jgi:uncharacterized protein (UPF0276 family)
MTLLQTRRRRLPPLTGIGLRAPHLAEVAADGRSSVAWVEVHPENYMGGGPAAAALLSIRRDRPVSLHGVGLSLGSADGIDQRHLARLKSLMLRVEPFLVSEHLSWSSVGGGYLNDLLPLPYTEEALRTVARNIARLQEALDRRVLIENPSRYIGWRHSVIPEAEFLAELARATGCGILCDVNNLYVTQHNCRADPLRWLDAVPADAVGEIHLAGHARNATAGGGEILIDDHGAPVAEPVWELFAEAVRRFPHAPALVEWDSNIPALAVLAAEARAADRLRGAAAVGVTLDAQVA